MDRYVITFMYYQFDRDHPAIYHNRTFNNFHDAVVYSMNTVKSLGDNYRITNITNESERT